MSIRGRSRWWHRAIVSVVSLASALSPPLSLAGRRPSSLHSNERIHPPFQNLDFGGRAFQYYEKKNADGHVVRQMLIGKDRVEILNDLDGDGKLESWDIFTKAGKMMFSFPFQGKFTFLDYEVMAQQGLMRFSYYWNRKKNAYTLYAQKGRPYKKFNLGNDFIVGCRGDAEEKKLEDLAEKLDRALDSGSMEQTLGQTLLKDAVDPSCKTGKFASQTSAMVAGMIAVAKSDKKDWNEKNARPKEQGQFLQCMRYHGLDVHASRIEAGMAQYSSLVDPGYRYAWKLQCSINNEAYGTFTEPSSYASAPKINFHLDAEGVKKMTGLPNPSPAQTANAYAAVFFHEMLHYSQMNELNADLVTNCCGNPNPKAGSEACNKLAMVTKDVEVKQAFENHLIQTLGGDGYAQLMATVRNSWPNPDEAELEFQSGLMNLAHEYNEAKKSPNCNGKSEKKPLGSCTDEFRQRTLALIDEMYGSQDGSECRKDVDQRLGAAQGKDVCEKMKQIFLSVANGGVATDALKKMCPVKIHSRDKSTFHRNLDSALRIALDVTSRPAFAVADENQNSLCEVANGLTPTEFQFDPRPAPEMDQQLSHDAAPDGSTATEGNRSLSPSPSGGKTPLNYTGPSVPHFSNDSKTRTDAIVNHINQTGGSIGQFQSIANSTYNLLVPKAQASSGSQKDRDFSNGYNLKLSAPSPLQNPLTNFGSNGAGGPAIAGRAPASVGPESASRKAIFGGSGSVSRVGTGPGVAGLDPSAKPPAAAGDPSKNPQGEEGRERAKRKLTPSEERALEALKEFLQGDDYPKVKKDLDRPSVEGALLDHAVRVIDDEGREYGAGFPDYKFVYDPVKKKLVPDLRKDPRAPKDRRR